MGTRWADLLSEWVDKAHILFSSSVSEGLESLPDLGAVRMKWDDVSSVSSHCLQVLAIYGPLPVQPIGSASHPQQAAQETDFINILHLEHPESCVRRDLEANKYLWLNCLLGSQSRGSSSYTWEATGQRR